LIKGHPTVRRFELYRGVLALAEWLVLTEDMDDHGEPDDVIRAIVHAVTLDDAALLPTIPPGQVLGMLNADEAARFALVADDLIHDRYTLVADEATGTLRLNAVA
jgi:hypothetical protein